MAAIGRVRTRTFFDSDAISYAHHAGWMAGQRDMAMHKAREARDKGLCVIAKEWVRVARRRHHSSMEWMRMAQP